jgi:DNA-directed RNA polymerase subunit beta
MTTQKVRLGRRTRDTFARTKEVLEMPDLIEIQRESYRWFEEVGLREAFDGISPIQDFTGNLKLEFLDYYFGKPKYSVDEARERDVTFSRPLRAKVRLINQETGEVKEQEVFMGDFPIMTETGTFIYNGAERVIVSQLVRSPGAYYKNPVDKNGNRLVEAKVIPNRGAWIEYNYDRRGIVTVRIDRSRKVPVTTFIRALGYGSDAQIYDLLGQGARVAATLEKDSTKSEEEGLLEVYRKIRPGEPPTVETSKSLLNAMFFQNKRYDLAKVGRYKFNKKLALAQRIKGCIAAETVLATEDIYQSKTIINEETGEVISNIGDLLVARGEVLVESDQKITDEVIARLKQSGINSICVELEDKRVIRVIGNGYFKKEWQDKISKRTTSEPILVNEEVLIPKGTYIDEDQIKLIKSNIKELYGSLITLKTLKNQTVQTVLADEYQPNNAKCLIKEDIIATISYIFNLLEGIGRFDDIDHLETEDFVVLVSYYKTNSVQVYHVWSVLLEKE